MGDEGGEVDLVEPTKPRRRWLWPLLSLLTVCLLVVAGIWTRHHFDVTNKVSDTCDQSWEAMSLEASTGADQSTLQDMLTRTADACSRGEWWKFAQKEMPDWAAATSRREALSAVCGEVPKAKACR